MERREKKPKPGDECDECFGSGHICARCGFPVNACIEGRLCDDLDTEEMFPCAECGATGVVQVKEVARA